MYLPKLQQCISFLSGQETNNTNKQKTKTKKKTKTNQIKSNQIKSNNQRQSNQINKQTNKQTKNKFVYLCCFTKNAILWNQANQSRYHPLSRMNTLR